MNILEMIRPTPKTKLLGPPYSSISMEPPTEEYLQLAKKLGVTCPKVQTLTTLEDVIRKEIIHIYPLAAVEKHMNRVTPKGKIWAGAHFAP